MSRWRLLSGPALPDEWVAWVVDGKYVAHGMLLLLAPDQNSLRLVEVTGLEELK